MTNSIFLLFGCATAAVAYSIYRALPIFGFRGVMLVTRPENLKPAAIKIAMWRAAYPSYSHYAANLDGAEAPFNVKLI